MTVDWPLDTNIIRGCSENNTFGPVRRDARGKPKNHQGWDFKASVGTPCHAIADGKIVALRKGGDYGLTIVQSFLVGGRELYAAFAHMDSSKVKIGDRVICGQLIGYTGNSGNAFSLADSQDHLHFEIRTTPTPGIGLEGRMSPLKVFGICPLSQPAKRKGAA